MIGLIVANDDCLIIIGFKFRMTEQFPADLQQKIDDYRNKMEEIAQNRNFLPLRYFEQAQNLIRNEVLQSHQQADSKPLLQKALIAWRNDLYSRNQTAISKWCHQLLLDSTNSIDKKICREIKSFTIYRQEILTTVELLRKKTQPYMTCELSLLIHDFILQKLFEHVGQLHSAALSQLQDHLKMMQIENKALGVQCREAKRRTNKQDNEAQRNISDLREKLSLADVRYALLEKNNEELRQELHLSQESKQQALLKANEHFNAELFQLRAQLEQRYDQARQAIKRSTFLEMQLQKQQLLHKQTMIHYQQLISNYHNKEEELKEEILEASRVSEKEIDHFKVLSTRRIQDWQQTANDLQEQLEQTQKNLKEKQSQVLSLKQTLITLKESSRSQIDNLVYKVSNLQLRIKILQEKEAQCDQLKNRLQKIDAQLKKLQRDRDQLNEQFKEIEKQKLIVDQQYQYLKIELEQEHSKTIALVDQLQQEKQNREIQNQRAKKQIASTISQTDENVYNQKLKAALALIRQLQSEYQKLHQPSYQRMRRTYH